MAGPTAAGQLASRRFSPSCGAGNRATVAPLARSAPENILSARRRATRPIRRFRTHGHREVRRLPGRSVMFRPVVLGGVWGRWGGRRNNDARAASYKSQKPSLRKPGQIPCSAFKSVAMKRTTAAGRRARCGSADRARRTARSRWLPGTAPRTAPAWPRRPGRPARTPPGSAEAAAPYRSADGLRTPRRWEPRAPLRAADSAWRRSSSAPSCTPRPTG